MRSAHMLCAALAWPVLVARVLATPPPLPAEHLTVERLPQRNPHWVYVFDYMFDNEIDARVYLYDGDNYRRLWQIGAGFLQPIGFLQHNDAKAARGQRKGGGQASDPGTCNEDGA